MADPYRQPSPPPPTPRRPFLCRWGFHLWVPRFHLEPQLHGDDDLKGDVMCQRCDYALVEHLIKKLFGG